MSGKNAICVWDDAAFKVLKATFEYVVEEKTSREIAVNRLMSIIRSDREAAQDGRWVEIPQKLGSDEHRRWLEIAIHSLRGPETYQSRMAFRKLKPHYQWQVRR